MSKSHYLNAPDLVEMQCFKRQKLNLNLFQILTCIFSLRKVQEVEFLTFLIDTAKPKTNFMIQKKNQYISHN